MSDLYWLSPFSLSDGYGVAAINYVEALLQFGVKLNIHECWFSIRSALPRELVEKLDADAKAPVRERLGISFATPGAFKRLPTAVKIGYTMYESTNPEKHFPSWYTDMANADAVIVPTLSSKIIFSEFYKKPIYIAPLPISSIYMKSEIRRRGQSEKPLTFGLHGTLTDRKCPLETIEAFRKAFPQNKFRDVRLEIKTKNILGQSNKLPKVSDNRIRFFMADWPPSTMLRWLYRIDCHLFFSRGEGFGIPPRESLVTGCPIIISETGGLVDLGKYGLVVPIAKKVPASTGGFWDEPDWGVAIEKMREVYYNRDIVYEKAILAAGQYRQDYRSDRIVASFMSAVGEIEKSILKGTIIPASELMAAKSIDDILPVLERLRGSLPASSSLLVAGFDSTKPGIWLAKRGFQVDEISLATPPSITPSNYRFWNGNLFELRSRLDGQHYDYTVAFISNEFRRRDDLIDVINEVFAISDDALLIIEGKPSSRLYVALEPLNFVTEQIKSYTLIAIDKKESRRGVEIKNLIKPKPKLKRPVLARSKTGISVRR